MRHGLYVHVPFCEQLCHYCDFNTYLLKEGGVDVYLRALEEEMARYASQEAYGIVFDTVFIGGGTPTALTAGQLTLLFSALRRHLQLSPDAEVTVEANPGTLTSAKLVALREGGANRLSLGVQAYQDHHLERLGRIHRFRHVLESVEKARAAGFANVNLDLMFALPQQTLGDWEETLNRTLDLRPEHVSCYSLIIEENTPFGEWHAAGQLPLVDEDEEARMFEATIERLTAAGYRHYEISNFARPGRECRHNLIYWRNQQWLGLGPGAHSQWAGERFANATLPADYARVLLKEQRLPIASRESLSRRVQMEDELILGLRLRDGVSLATFRDRFGVEALIVFEEALSKARRAGLVDWDEDRLYLTERGVFLANEVFRDLISE